MYTNTTPLKDLAMEVAINAGVWEQIPVPVERVADSLRLVTMAFEPVGRFANMAGAINHQQRVIYFNRRDPAVRQRFTIAHEIGHAVLHENENIVDYRMNIDQPRDIKEIEANKFAAELLMPEDVFREVWLSRAADTRRVGAYFGLSEPAVRIRADNLGLPRRY